MSRARTTTSGFTPSRRFHHDLISPFYVAAALGTVFALPAGAHEVADPTIKRSLCDGVVRLYGAGGPGTAFKKVAAAFTDQTSVNVEVTGGLEPTSSR